MELLEIMRHRRSVRHFTGEAVPEDKLKKILEAGLMSASGKGRRPWELIVVRDKILLGELAKSRDNAANQRMTAEADLAIVVVCDSEKADTWVEDGSIVLANMHLMADALGLGSCWLQGHLRTAENGQSTCEYVQNLLGIPSNFQLIGSLVVGVPAQHGEPYKLEELPFEKVHENKF